MKRFISLPITSPSGLGLRISNRTAMFAGSRMPSAMTAMTPTTMNDTISQAWFGFDAFKLPRLSANWNPEASVMATSVGMTRYGGEACGTTRSGPTEGRSFFIVELAPRFGPGPDASMPARGPYAVQRFRPAELRPVEAVKRHEGKAEQGHDEPARHIVLIGDVTHYFGQERASHNGHDDVGGGLFRPGAKTEDAKREDGGKHDGHEEEAKKDTSDREPAQPAENQQAHNDIQHPIEAQDFVGGEPLQQASASEPPKEEQDKGHG